VRGKKSDRFELTHAIVDGLIDSGFLRAAQRHDESAVQAALEKFLKAKFPGADEEKSRPRPPRPAQVRPVATHVVSPVEQQTYNDLVLERLLVVLAKRELVPPEVAIQVLEEALIEAGRRGMPAPVADSARFAKEVLAFELKGEGLL